MAVFKATDSGEEADLKVEYSLNSSLTKSISALPKGTEKQLRLQWTTSAIIAWRKLAKSDPVSFSHTNIGMPMETYSGNGVG